MSDNNYDVIPFSMVNGKLYLGVMRSATYAEREKSGANVHLYEAQIKGATFAGTVRSGYCQQMEKADDICRLWVEEGKVSINFHEDKKE